MGHDDLSFTVSDGEPQNAQVAAAEINPGVEDKAPQRAQDGADRGCGDGKTDAAVAAAGSIGKGETKASGVATPDAKRAESRLAGANAAVTPDPPVPGKGRLNAPDRAYSDAAGTLKGQARQSTIRLSVAAQDVDAHSNQYQCVVRVENTGGELVRIMSLRPLSPAGTKLQQVIDTTQSDARLLRDATYRDLSFLANGVLFEESADYRKKMLEHAQAMIKETFSFNFWANAYYRFMRGQFSELIRKLAENPRAWSIEIRGSAQGQKFYDDFLRSRESARADVCLVYRTKLETVRQLESDLGDSGPHESISDPDPGAIFSRTYIYNCERRPLNVKSYTFSYDCSYVHDGSPERPKHISESITAVIAPNPFLMNIIAIIASALGSILKISLDALSVKSDGTAVAVAAQTLTSQVEALLTLPHYEAVFAAMLTALFFYNIYDSTDAGRKLSIGTGWRNALIIGGLSGLLNDRIIAALRGLIG